MSFQNMITGGTAFPVNSTGKALFVLDRALYRLLEFSREILTTNLDPYFANVCAERGIRRKITVEGGPDQFEDYTSIVADTSAVDTQSFLLTNQFNFPLLALYRVSGKPIAPQTRNDKGATESTLILEFALPEPFGIYRDALATDPFLNAAQKLLASKLEVGLRANGSKWQQGEDLGTVKAGQHMFRELVGNATASQDKQAFFPALRMEVILRESAVFNSSDLILFDSLEAQVDTETEDLPPFTVAEGIIEL